MDFNIIKYLENRKRNNIIKLVMAMTKDFSWKDINSSIELKSRCIRLVKINCLIGKEFKTSFGRYLISGVKEELGGVFLDLIDCSLLEDGGKRISWEELEKLFKTCNIDEEYEDVKEVYDIRIEAN